MSDKLKVLIVEDDAVIGQLLEHHMRQLDHHVLDVVYSSERALDLIHNVKPDLILLDINILGEKDGIEVGGVIQSKYNIPFIFITALSDRTTLQRAQAVNPVGYIVKPFKESDINASISIGMANFKNRNKETEITETEINQLALSPLSSVEIKILLDISKGLTNDQIAMCENLSLNTVKWHTQNIFSKLGVKNRTSAAQLILSNKRS